MARTLPPPDKLLVLLERTAPRIAAATKGVAATRLQTAPLGDEWSPNDVLAHLRSCADVWGNWIRTILAEDGPTIRAINPRTWIRDTNYAGLRFGTSFRAFTKQRTGLLDVLRPLSAEAWVRTATVTGGGKPLLLTVQRYAERMAVHERAHAGQIERMLAT